VKFDGGMAWPEKLRAITQWHPWFAWHPVRITGTRQIVWLERIERCACFEYSGMAYAYRPIDAARLEGGKDE
jgi:hypothetical protein